MHDLAPLCALGDNAPRTDTVAGVTLTEHPGHAFASIAARLGQETACAAQLATLLGGAAPKVGAMVSTDTHMAFWIGPDQWMISAPFDTHEDLATQLTARFGKTASITDQTDAWVCFDMQGDGVEQVMQLCANIDIEQMQVGAAARSVIHYMGVYVIRTAKDALTILGGRSSAGSLHHALLTAMRAAL
ncbi:MAG: sarcosine oxidase subunit gamma [Pelagibaca sp.]